jgi:hypothetical protein
MVLLSLLLFATPTLARELVRKCLKGDCASLAVEGNSVIFRETSGYMPSPRNFGRYIAADHALVPATEAPIRDVRTRGGWIVIATAALDDYAPDGPTIRIRLIDKAGRIAETFAGGDNILDKLSVSSPFGAETNVVVAETSGFHAYVVTVFVWLIAPDGPPKLLVKDTGGFSRFGGNKANGHAGLWIDHETYDFVHAETKGHRLEFWQWDDNERSLGKAPVKVLGRRPD